MSEESGIEPVEAWIIAVLLWLAVGGTTAYEIAPASVLSVVAGDLNVGSTGVSWLVSIYLLGMAVFSIPSGLALDRIDNRHAIAGFGLLFTLTTVGAGIAAETGAFWAVGALRFVGGCVTVFLWTAAVNVVGSAFAQRRQGTGLGFLSTSIPGGFAVAHVSAPLLDSWIGWELGFLAFGGVTALSAVALWIYARGFDLRTSLETPTRSEFFRVLANRWVWVVGALAFIGFALNIFFNNWLPTFLVDQYDLSLAQGGLFAAVFPAIGAVARLLSGAVSDRLLGGRRKPIVFGSFVVIAPIIVLVTGIRTLAVLVVALVVAGFATQMGLALLFPYVRELVAENVASTALSVLNVVGFGGAFVTPILTGALIDWTGTFSAAFLYATALAVLGVGLSWMAPEPGLADGQ
jgi:nitrate/nitrite transporter NarK